MKIQIRQNIFETNSSSTHTITMCYRTEYDNWRNGKVKFCEYDEKFLPTEEADKINLERMKLDNYETYQDFINNYENIDLTYYYVTFDEYYKYVVDVFEVYNKEFNDIIAFGYYG